MMFSALIVASLEKVGTDSNDADVLTKSLEKEKHWRHVWALGMRPLEAG